MFAPLVCVFIFTLVFLLVEAEKVDRNQATVAGAVMMLVLGWLLNFYSLHQALRSVYFDTLALIFGMSLIVDALIRSGLFRVFAKRVSLYSRGEPRVVLVLLVLIGYGLALVIGNLATMLIILPLTLALCSAVGLLPVPLIIAEIIATNLGGASTLIGDFPNMVIGAAGRLHFDDFIGGMMAPCLLMLGILLVYFDERVLRVLPRGVRPLTPELSETPPIDRYLARLGVSVLTVTLVALVFAVPLGLQPSSIALYGGMVIMLAGRIPQDTLLKAMSGSEILFFAALFVMVGGLQAAGVLMGLHDLIVSLGGGHPTQSAILLMWVGAVLTPFLNSGPTTVLLVPVAAALSQEYAGVVVWWALALGILAGSSATLTGATAGPVVASQMVHQLEEHRRVSNAGWVLDSASYRQVGVPLTLIFLLFSTIYITLVST